VNLTGEMDISGKGEINEENIDSKLKFIVSKLSCETENERIKSLVKKINEGGFLEIDYKIYGTTSNPFLTYDINF
jgi:ribosomal protein L12E/L44/L45/RPP1/RPP2